MWKCCQPQHDFTTASPFPTPLSWQLKHCQRQNGPEGWVQLTKVYLFMSYHKIKHKYWLFFFLQNIDHASISKSRPNISVSTKLRIQNIDQTKTSAAKYWPNSSFKSCLNFNFKILTKLFAQSLNKHLDFWPNLGFQICNKLLPTRSSSATVTTSTSFELASSHARVTSIKSTKHYGVSELVSQSVSELVTRVNNDRTRVR